MNINLKISLRMLLWNNLILYSYLTFLAYFGISNVIFEPVLGNIWLKIKKMNQSVEFKKYKLY